MVSNGRSGSRFNDPDMNFHWWVGALNLSLAGPTMAQLGVFCTVHSFQEFWLSFAVDVTMKSNKCTPWSSIKLILTRQSAQRGHVYLTSVTTFFYQKVPSISQALES